MKKLCTAAVAAAMVLGVCATDAFAQAWPRRPIKMIVPFSAGGPTDLLARSLARSMTESLGLPVVVENKLGAAGAIGVDAIAKAAPDGYTFGFAHTGTMAINPHLFAKHPFDPLSEITPITPIVAYANVLVVNANIPVKTVAEFLAWAKANPAHATYASGGSGGTNHLSGEILKGISGVNMVHVPYKGNAPAILDLVAGNVSAMFDLPASLMPHIKSEKVRPLAITGTARSSFLPDVPTMRQAGYPGFEEAGSDLWIGLVGPANLPPELSNRIYLEIQKALATKEMQDAVRAQAYEGWTMKPADFKTFIRKDFDKWGNVVKMSGARVD